MEPIFSPVISDSSIEFIILCKVVVDQERPVAQISISFIHVKIQKKNESHTLKIFDRKSLSS